MNDSPTVLVHAQGLRKDYGSGEGLGAIYFSEDGLLQLLHDVHLKLTPPSSAISGKRKTAPTEITVTGSSLELGKLTHRIVLQGPVLADAGQEKLTAGELTLQLDDAFHAKNLIATPGALGKNPEVLAANPGEEPLVIIQASINQEGVPAVMFEQPAGVGPSK